uniref:Uncharacterized protein n=1 Tax=Amphora coffeiformis TaxID=265554 RepID=A0A7S3LGQ3_9STRA|mmetsp:Transcript_8207/g.15900  ORF Transcript_8207/g.15900 Transcript_8207/m.15900 type:complete len:123 (-) Transcript_8207:147-515(-)|eukprot:scaffold3038_cov163-Amphora_coffeaeformis.AAC.9
MTNKQLKSFLLRLVVSTNENAAQILSMDGYNYLLRAAENAEFVTFQDGETNVNKVQLLLDMFDSPKKNRVLQPLLLSWVNEAVEKIGTLSPMTTLTRILPSARTQVVTRTAKLLKSFQSMLI